MDINDEKNIDPIQEIIRLAHDVIDFSQWNFQESFRSVNAGIMIYNSLHCRVNITWGGWDSAGGNSISIHYGRVHAPNEESKMLWNGEECYAWHEIELPMHFLDGELPAKAIEIEYSHRLLNKYYEESYRKKFYRRQPEWLMNMHMEVWDHYGERFFELFDLRRPDLWEQYRKFLKEFYDIKGRIPFIKPPMDKVC